MGGSHCETILQCSGVRSMEFKKTQMLADEVCETALEKIRWGSDLCCLRCGSIRIKRLTSLGKSGKPRKLFWCHDCHYQFSVTVGTPFEDSHISLSKWFWTIFRMSSSGSPLSARQIERRLSLAYESAWTMRRRTMAAWENDPEFCRKIARFYLDHLETPAGPKANPFSESDIK